MIYKAFKYKQQGQDFFSLILPLKIISQISTVLEYGKSEYGYQRAVNPKHLKEIKRSIDNFLSKPVDNLSLVSPTSIILGINRSDYEKLNITEIEDILKIELTGADNFFRIIDGQHRIEAFKSMNDSRLDDYLFNVIVLVVEDKKRIIEVKTFSDINSKAKPLKMDLTILAEYNYEILEQANNLEFEKHLAIKIAYYLNDISDGSNIWLNGIKFDVNATKSLGIIGFKTFYESIKPICKKYIVANNLNFENKNYDNKIKLIDQEAKKIAEQLILPYWNLISLKWEECFYKNFIFYNNEDYTIFYDTNYYIQSTMGVKALHLLLKESLDNNNNDFALTLKNLKHVLGNSNIKSYDWKKGGRFSGLSSEAGFKKIIELIKEN